MMLAHHPHLDELSVRIFAWKLILGSTGLLNSVLLLLGVIETLSPILIYSRAAVMVTLIYVWIPFAMLADLFLAGAH